MKLAETLGVKKKKLIPKAMATRQVFKRDRQSLTGSLEPRVTCCTSQQEKLSILLPSFSLLFFHVFLPDRKDSNSKNGSQDDKSKDLLTDTSGTLQPCQQSQLRLHWSYDNALRHVGTSEAPAHVPRRFLPLWSQATMHMCQL